jgi:hypothetical protein
MDIWLTILKRCAEFFICITFYAGQKECDDIKGLVDQPIMK